MPAKELDAEALHRAAECLKIIAHPVRLQIIRLLLAERCTVGELATRCEVPPHVASEHLRLMERCGLFAREKEGRRVYYRIAEPELANIMACVEHKFAT